MTYPSIKQLLICLVLLIFILPLPAQSPDYQNHWTIHPQKGIVWQLDQKQNLPHSDNIEMAGRKVAGIVHYSIDTSGFLSLERDIFFPQLHPYIKANDPAWFIYRSYLKSTFKDDILPSIYSKDKAFVPGPLSKVSIKGYLQFEHQAASGLALQRQLFPSTDERLFVEKWILTNTTDSLLELQITDRSMEEQLRGEAGLFSRQFQTDAKPLVQLQAGESYQFGLYIMAKKSGESYPTSNAQTTFEKRDHLLKQFASSLVLETPDPILNTLFDFSKIRASESIFDSQLGLIHSPGGGRYYCGIWANDQAEYVSPFFPYLGYEIGNQSAINTYRAFDNETNAAYQKIRYAFEIEGIVPPFMLDRGDAAMIAYGASQFVLANGDRQTALDNWPLIEWCLEYCHRQLNADGVVQSESDEMEGRIETGTANLSTSSLYYGALNLAIDLGKSLGQSADKLAIYEKRARALEAAMEAYFGAKVEGLETYRYYQGHQYLRHWICLPLVVNIHDRKAGTIEALFDRLWTDNGVHVEKNSDNEAISKIFWDRGTLYALRGTFLAGATEPSLQKLKQFSKERLLGKRVPYVVEAYPEGNMAHLSAESALYCRVFIEGLFGIQPTGLRSFRCQAQLPAEWDQMALRHIKAFGQDFDLRILREKNQLRLQVKNNRTAQLIYNQAVTPMTFVEITFME